MSVHKDGDYQRYTRSVKIGTPSVDHNVRVCKFLPQTFKLNIFLLSLDFFIFIIVCVYVCEQIIGITKFSKTYLSHGLFSRTIWFSPLSIPDFVLPSQTFKFGSSYLPETVWLEFLYLLWDFCCLFLFCGFSSEK